MNIKLFETLKDQMQSDQYRKLQFKIRNIKESYNDRYVMQEYEIQ